MAIDLKYLADLDVTHSVVSAQMAVNPDISGGLLIKLLFNRGPVLVFVSPDQDIDLTSALRRFLRCCSLSKHNREAAEFDRRVPMIGHADWDAITSDNQVVQVGALAMPTMLAIELLFANAGRLPLLLSAGVASRLEAALAAALPFRLKHPHVPIPPGHA